MRRSFEASEKKLHCRLAIIFSMDVKRIKRSPSFIYLLVASTTILLTPEPLPRVDGTQSTHGTN